MDVSVGSVLSALADPTRRAILESVRRGPRSVNDIAGDFEVSRPAVSQHLRVLEEAALLRSHRSGRQNFYSLDLRGLTQLRSYVESYWEDVLGAFQAAAVRDFRKSKKEKVR
jgi:DNA-binding transcriptional ArsR family regulator